MPPVGEQHGSVSRPHSHVPATQVPEAKLDWIVQVEPFATHRPFVAEVGSTEQQAPAALQAFPAQQGLPVMPHIRQVPLWPTLSQTTPEPLQVEPAQHGSSTPPQWTQKFPGGPEVDAAQTAVLTQVVPPQQG
jgi:hypothetical protein